MIFFGAVRAVVAKHVQLNDARLDIIESSRCLTERGVSDRPVRVIAVGRFQTVTLIVAFVVVLQTIACEQAVRVNSRTILLRAKSEGNTMTVAQ